MRRKEEREKPRKVWICLCHKFIFIMGSNRSVLVPQEEIQMICDETGRVGFELGGFGVISRILGFTAKEVQRLYVRFQELEKRNPRMGFLTREDLLNINEVALNPLGERLVDVLIEDYGKIFSLRNIIDSCIVIQR
jgi:hypothetical protein